jgi:hypothetical protein
LPWFAITWVNFEGFPLRRELLHRDSERKIWNFVKGRIQAYDAVPPKAQGVFFREAEKKEIWNEIYEKAIDPSYHPVEIETRGDYLRPQVPDPLDPKVQLLERLRREADAAEEDKAWRLLHGEDDGEDDS